MSGKAQASLGLTVLFSGLSYGDYLAGNLFISGMMFCFACNNLGQFFAHLQRRD